MTIESRGNILHKALEKQEEEVSWACAHMCVTEHAVSGGWPPTLMMGRVLPGL